MAKSTQSARAGKVKKPYDGFPLFPHAAGVWAKKIRGKLTYFGPVADDPDGTKALERFNREWPYLKDGRTPPAVQDGDGCTIKALCNAFLTSKRNKLASGEISERCFADYYRVCDRLVQHLKKGRRVDDLRPDDFEGLRKALADGRGPVALWNEVSRIRMVFKYALDQRIITQPVHYGQSFNRPSASVRRRARQEQGLRMFEADELRTILAAAKEPLRTMVLLGINCGLGQSDCANMQRSHLDLSSGWLRYPRPKTGVARSIPLWPASVEALRTAADVRPAAIDAGDAECVFLTKYGNRFVRTKTTRLEDRDRCTAIDAVALTFGRLLKTLGINGNRNFYALRHTFQTIGGEAKDPEAVSSIMGHVDPTMAGLYRERISDDRLRAVVAVVHQWLFAR